MTSCVTPILEINIEEYSISKLGNLGEKGYFIALKIKLPRFPMILLA